MLCQYGLLKEGGDPNVEGRDGSLPLMVCLVPLVNRDHLHHFTYRQHTPFENPQRWMGQNTFPILLLNDDNMIGEH